MKLKRLHTDGAKEQSTKKLNDLLDSTGKASTHTAPNASPSNAFAEWRFRQLMASARTPMAAAPHMPKACWFFAVLDAADKGKYLAAARNGRLQASSYATINSQCPDADISSPASFLPRGNKGNAVIAVKIEKKLDNGA